MTVRFALPILLLFGVLSVRAAPVSFSSPRKAFAIAYSAPAGWTGPTYAGGPALDSWTFFRGPGPAADTLEIRIYDAKDSLIRWDTATDAAILANFRDYADPHIERMPTLKVDGRPARILALHSDGIDEFLANVYFGDSLVSVMLASNTPKGLAKHREAFLGFVRSLHFGKSR